MTQTITPHLVVRDATAMADWYRRALGAEERQRVTLPDGRVMSLELRIGGASVRIADEFPEMGIISPRTLGGTYGALVLATDDVERDWQRAIEAGAEVFHPLQETFWGDRSGQIIDPSGHRWGFAQHLRDVPPDEVARAAAAAFAR
jgi:PhnB protein